MNKQQQVPLLMRTVQVGTKKFWLLGRQSHTCNSNEKVKSNPTVCKLVRPDKKHIYMATTRLENVYLQV